MARMPRLLAWMLTLAGLGGALCAQEPAGSQPAPTTASAPAEPPLGDPASAPASDFNQSIRRLVTSIDFEGFEASGETIPEGWEKASLPDGRFPIYLKGALDRQHAHTGKTSFRLELDGGNIAYAYSRGMPVYPSNDYLLTGWVRTDKLRVARAQVRLAFLDAAGEPIANAEAIGPPLGGPDSPADGQWQSFTVLLRGEFPQATRLRLTLALLQPRIWQGSQCKDIYQQDIAGQVWWDDLNVYRLPRIDLQSTTVGGVFVPGQTPGLKVTLDGIDDAECGVVLTVRDANEGLIRQQIIEVNPNQPRTEVKVDLGELDVGLYTGELAISSGGNVLMRKYCRLARLADVPLVSRTGLGLDATSLPSSDWETLLVYLRCLQGSAVKLSAWPAQVPATEGVAGAWPMHAMLERLGQMGATPTMVLPGLPPEMKVNATAIPPLVDALADESPALQQALAVVVAQYTRHTGPWQIGPTRDYEALWNPRLYQASQVARRWLGKLLVRPEVLLSWNAMLEYDLQDAQAARPPLSLLIPQASLPEQIPAQLANFPIPACNAHVELQSADTPRVPRLADFALRYAYTRAAGIDTVFIDPPWEQEPGGLHQPAETLLVARTLAAYLGETRFLGVARLDTQSIALVFGQVGRAGAAVAGNGGEGVMLLYSRMPEADAPALALDLPSRAYQVDLWGRRQPLERRNGLALLRPGAVPVLIAGVDAGPLGLRATLAMTPEVLPSRYQRHSATLSFANPYDQPVTGQVRISPPEGWTVSPKVERFALAPGQTWNSKLELSFPYNASAGLKQLDVQIQLDARESWSLRAPAFFYLDLEGVAFDVIQSTGPDGALEVQQVITNRTDKPMSFDCFVQAPDRPRQTRAVQNLAPGATAIKLFRFPNVAKLRGKELRAGLREVAGSAVLNRSVVIR